MGTKFSFSDRGYHERLNAFMGNLKEDRLYGFKSHEDIQKAMREANIWDDHGFYNQNNEKIVGKVWEQAEMIRPLVEEKNRVRDEATLAAEAKKQAQARATQKQKSQATQGRRGTLLTSPAGVVDAPIEPRKTLLGL